MIFDYGYDLIVSMNLFDPIWLYLTLFGTIGLTHPAGSCGLPWRLLASLPFLASFGSINGANLSKMKPKERIGAKRGHM